MLTPQFLICKSTYFIHPQEVVNGLWNGFISSVSFMLRVGSPFSPAQVQIWLHHSLPSNQAFIFLQQLNSDLYNYVSWPILKRHFLKQLCHVSPTDIITLLYNQNLTFTFCAWVGILRHPVNSRKAITSFPCSQFFLFFPLFFIIIQTVS